MKYLVSTLAITVVMQLSILGVKAQPVEGVYVNGVPLTDFELQTLAVAYGTQPPPGKYWYDPVSGLWGVWGGPPTGQIQDQLPFAGGLSADASGGTSGVFINGRQISDGELSFLGDSLGTLGAGSYTLDPQQAQEVYSPLWASGPAPVPVDPVPGPGTGCNFHYGPYATMRRAQEVANELQSNGLVSVAFHNGDGYYVNARCP